MFSTDRISADRRVEEYKNIAMNNAQLTDKKNPAIKKSFMSRLISIVNI